MEDNLDISEDHIASASFRAVIKITPKKKKKSKFNLFKYLIYNYLRNDAGACLSDLPVS